MSLSSERDFFSKGLAVGGMDIVTNTARWRFRDEEYETSATVFWALKEHVLRCPVAPVEAIRRYGVRLP